MKFKKEIEEQFVFDCFFLGFENAVKNANSALEALNIKEILQEELNTLEKPDQITARTMKILETYNKMKARNETFWFHLFTSFFVVKGNRRKIKTILDNNYI